MKRMGLHLWLPALATATALVGGERFIGAVESKSSAPKSFAMARLLDAGERPLAGATIRPTGVSTGPSTTWGTIPPGFPKEIRSDTNGNFILSRAEPFTRVQVHIDAPNVGAGELWLSAGNVLTVIHLGPFEMRMPSRAPGTPATDFRPSRLGAPPFGSGASAFEPGSRPDWTNSPAPPGGKSWHSTEGSGELIVQLSPFPPGQSNSAAHPLVRRVKLAGRVQTSTGEPLPSGLQVFFRSGVEREHAEPDGEGKFDFSSVPVGEVTVWIEPGMSISHEGQSGTQWSGWRLAASNRNRRLFMPRSEVVGLLEQAKDDLLLVIEYARAPFGAFNANRVPDAPERRPLWGAETSGPPFITLSGQIVDDRTGQAVKGVKIIPKRKEPIQPQPPVTKSVLKQVVDTIVAKPAPDVRHAFLDETEAQISSNGTFCISFVPLPFLPFLRVEADGYVPLETELWAQSTNNLVIRLKAGAGPSGRVLRADDQPAVGASVVYLTGDATASLQNRKLRAYTDQALQVIGPDGRFAFKPALQAGTVTAADPSGWAEAKLDGTEGELKLRLKPWAAVKGKLMATNGTPAAGMVLVLALPRLLSNGATTFQQLGRATTDTNGGFEFLDVPPRRLALQRIAVRPGSNSGPSRQQTWLIPEPGITNDLGEVVCDPPPSLLETLKRKLGL